MACKRRDDEKILHKHYLVLLPQLYQKRGCSGRMIKRDIREKSATKNISSVLLAWLEEGLREMGQCVLVMSASERPKKNEVPTEVGGKLGIQ